MSRATSAVESCASSGPAFVPHAVSNLAKVLSHACCCAAPIGNDSDGGGAQQLLFLRVAIEALQDGALPDAARIEADHIEPRAHSGREQRVPPFSMRLTPEAPGPPGLKNSVPIRWAGSVAGCLITAMLIFVPSGLA